ncbi:MAG: DUF6114 domain-containing protein [Thermoplasmata archaeon]|nr:DUF6114 domain-containing protein [Thermoplasmata archaeon]
MEENRPQLAFALTVIAGLLMLVEGAVFLIAGSVANSLGYSAASALLSGIALLGMALGFIVVLLAALLWVYPEAHVALGVVIVAVSILSFFGGGGFLIGILLGLLGGILAIVFETSEEESGVESLFPRRAPDRPTACWNCGRPFLAGSAVCAGCGAFPRS